MDEDELSTISLGGAKAPRAEQTGLRLPPRYHDLGPLGAGGMGEVRRVLDMRLDQVLVMKLTHPQLAALESGLRRFEREARITARLQHPGVVSVHDFGQLDDGRMWFTMPEVRGRTLTRVIRGVHEVSRGGWATDAEGWHLRRLVDAFASICQTVAYAHARGVVHRDLKPANVMVGAFGEVRVMDWGLACVPGESWEGPLGEVELSPAPHTQHGAIVGTPAYMSPEQAAGLDAHRAPTTDVWALGAILHEILTGRPPERSGRFAPAERLEPTRPAALVALAERCLDAAPSARPPDAAGVGEAVRAWLDGAERAARARRAVAEADGLRPEVHALHEKAGWSRAEAARALAPLPPNAPEAQKRRAWALEDEAAALEVVAAHRETTYESTLHAALREDAESTEAHARLADLYKERLVRAERRRDADGAARAETLLRAHDRGRHRDWLQGEGVVSLRTEPAGARVELFRHEAHSRRLKPVSLGPIGDTPLREHALPRGSYLLRVEAADHAPLLYPVNLERRGAWACDAPVPLLPALDEDAVYVPAGPFVSGGDPEAPEALPRRVRWVDGFVIDRFPVTCRQWLDFLDALAAGGHPDVAAGFAPTEVGEFGAGERPLAVPGSDGFALRPDSMGLRWGEDWPITQITWTAATAYAAWRAERDGLPWRLPHDQEWEKAARGVDGRLFPWGDHFEPTRARMQRSVTEGLRAVAVTAYPIDVSPYGVRGMAGNVRDWCRNHFALNGPEGDRVDPLDGSGDPEYRMCRGGSWISSAAFCRVAGRFVGREEDRFASIGVRLVRSV